MSELNDQFHEAINANSFKELEDILDNTDSEFDVNQVIPTRHTALHLAVEYNNIDMVKLLLAKGSNLNLKTAHGDTCLHLAAKRGNVNIVDLLVDRVDDIDAVNNDGCTALHEAIRNGRSKVVESLLEANAKMNTQRSDGGNTPLHDAVEQGSVGMIDLLLSHNADPDLQNSNGDSAFYLSLAHANRFNDILKVVNLFLDNKAGIELKNDNLENALHIAAYNCSPEVVDRLLQVDMHMEVNETARGALTAVHAAVMSPSSDNQQIIDKIDLLADCGADIDAYDENGDAPLNTAVKMHKLEIVEYLLEKGADVNHSHENQAVNSALENGDIDIVRKCLEYGAKIEFDDERLLFRCLKMNSLPGVRYLIENGAFCYLDTEVGQQVFMYLIRCDELPLVIFFLNKGADINAFYQSVDLPQPVQPLEYAYKIYKCNRGGVARIIDVLIRHVAMLVANNHYVHEAVMKRIKTSDPWMSEVYEVYRRREEEKRERAMREERRSDAED